jgi:hypothetical protein
MREMIAKMLVAMGLVAAGFVSPQIVVRAESSAMPYSMMCTLKPAQAAGEAATTFAAITHPVVLGQSSVRVSLEPVVKSDTRTLSQTVGELASGKHIYLVVKDLRTIEAPGVLYRIYLDLPEGTQPNRVDPHYVGSVNFFNVQSLGGAADDKGSRGFSFDITAVLKNLRAQDLLCEKTTVTIIPSGVPEGKSQPSIGRLELVAK